MKKVLYIIIGVMCLGCSHRGQSSEALEDTVYIAPDSVWDYTYVDSVTKRDKAYSYDSYGDSSTLYKIPTEGLPN